MSAELVSQELPYCIGADLGKGHAPERLPIWRYMP
jgi:hypothetical protein